MAITRVNEFQARAGEGEPLRELIASFVPTIEAADGCLSCRVLRGREDRDRIVVLEEWESVEAHQAATRAIPPETFQEAMKLLAGPPSGAYYDA